MPHRCARELLVKRSDFCFVITASLNARARLLDGLGYHATLERGYAVVRSNDAVITKASSAATKNDLEIEFRDGRVSVSTKG